MPDASAEQRTQHRSEYENERRAKLEKLRELGVDPYGHRVDSIEPLADIRGKYDESMGHDGGPTVLGQGRIVLKRDMGKLSFITLRDASGDLQIGLDKKRLAEHDDNAWAVRNLLDLGDRLAVEGALGTTNKGETTIWVTKIHAVAKALVPPPDKYHGLEDTDLRYRQRYTDLWANPEVMDLAVKRTQIVQHIREFLRNRGYIEVETPMLQSLQGGAAARPFTTHHNALDIPLFMRIAPELYLKRLLVGGMPKVFEIGRNFRNEGISPRHNPEFTMLEAYEAFGSWETMAEWVEELVCELAEKFCGGLKIEHPNGRMIDLTRPWRRASMAELVEERTGWAFSKCSLADADADVLQALATALTDDAADEIEKLELTKDDVQKLAARISDEDLRLKIVDLLTSAGTDIGRRNLVQFTQFCIGATSPAEQLVNVYEKLVEPTLINPTFVTRVPSVIIPLAKPCVDDPYFADVYELAINGQEISPGYTELNDPDVQEDLFRQQVGDDAEKQAIDHDFLNALKVGMPPAGGMGLGIDRLIMLLTGAESIRDVLLFPLMRPTEKPSD
ncbi:MAG: amino acid--tRNA ligase-related protein [Planctomycetota bacterium]